MPIRADAYTFAGHAADVARLLASGRPVVVIGHSMGGVVALELAGGSYGVDVIGVVGLGIKVVWSAEELDRATALAERTPQLFVTREEAVDRFLKLSGLGGLAHPDDPVVEAGVRATNGGWQLTMDPKGFGFGEPAMSALLTTDYQRALNWYERLLGSEPAFLPNAKEAVWELAEHRYLYIEDLPDRAGYAQHRVFVDELHERVEGIAARGVEPASQEMYDNGVRKVIYRDPDGNEVALAGAPA